VRKVRDVLECMHVDTSEGGAVMSRWGFRSVHYLEVKKHCKTLGDQGVCPLLRVSTRRGSTVSQVH